MMFKLSREKFSVDNVINALILLQMVSIGFFMALSSISLGVWVILWVYKLIKEKESSSFVLLYNKYRYFLVFLGLYILAELLSRIFAVFPDNAIIGIKRYLLILVFFANQNVIKNKEQILKNLTIIIAVFSILSCVEIYKFGSNLTANLVNNSFSEIRIDYFSYPITNGEMKMLLLLAVFPFIITKKKYIVKKRYLIPLLIPIAVSLFFTQSRNVYLGLLASLIIYGLFRNPRFLVIFILLLCIGWVFSPESVKSRAKSIFDINHPSNSSRLVMWNVGLQVFKDHPLIGVGDNEITKVYRLYKTPESHGEGSHFHSNPIMIMVTTGTAGAVLYLLFWASLLCYAINDYRLAKEHFDKELLMGIIITMISFHISGIFEWNFGDWEVITLLYYIISLIFVLKFINHKNILNGKPKII